MIWRRSPAAAEKTTSFWPTYEQKTVRNISSSGHCSKPGRKPDFEHGKKVTECGPWLVTHRLLNSCYALSYHITSLQNLNPSVITYCRRKFHIDLGPLLVSSSHFKHFKVVRVRPN